MSAENTEKDFTPEVEDIDPKEELEMNAVPSGSSSTAAPSSVDQGDDEPEDKVDVIDTIEPKAEPHNWTLQEFDSDQNVVEERTYIQRPLKFMAKMKFFALVGEVIDKSITGDDDKDGLRLSALFDGPGMRGGQLNASDFREADMFVQGVGKILQYAPDFLEKSYCIWLGIPDYEQDWAKEQMENLSDDDGLEIMEVFIDQNWDSLEDFFREKIASLRDRVNARRQKEEEKKALGA